MICKAVVCLGTIGNTVGLALNEYQFYMSDLDPFASKARSNGAFSKRRKVRMNGIILVPKTCFNGEEFYLNGTVDRRL